MLEQQHDEGDEADRLNRIADAFVERVMRRAESEPRHQAHDECDEQPRAPREATINIGRQPIDGGEHHAREQAVDPILRVGERSVETAVRNGDRAQREHGQADEPERGEDRAYAKTPSHEQKQHRR